MMQNDNIAGCVGDKDLRKMATITSIDCIRKLLCGKKKCAKKSISCDVYKYCSFVPCSLKAFCAYEDYTTCPGTISKPCDTPDVLSAIMVNIIVSYSTYQIRDFSLLAELSCLMEGITCISPWCEVDDTNVYDLWDVPCPSTTAPCGQRPLKPTMVRPQKTMPVKRQAVRRSSQKTVMSSYGWYILAGTCTIVVSIAVYIFVL